MSVVWKDTDAVHDRLTQTLLQLLHPMTRPTLFSSRPVGRHTRLQQSLLIRADFLSLTVNSVQCSLAGVHLHSTPACGRLSVALLWPGLVCVQ